MARLVAASFAADFLQFMIFTAVPFEALRLGADPLQMGILAALSPGTYAILVLAGGRWSDRAPRLVLARASCIGLVGACLALGLADSLPRLMLSVPLIGASMSLFWPSVQASIADRSTAATLERNLGRFNFSWSIGKGAGFLLGGTLLAAIGPDGVLNVACAVAFALFFVLPWPTRRLGAPPATPDPEAIPARALLEASTTEVLAMRYRPLAWIANGTAYGLAATLLYHLPRLVEHHGWGPRTYGIFLGLVFFTQTFVFAILTRHLDAWRFRRGRLYAPQVVLALAAWSLPFAGRERLLLTALIAGIGLGICYFSSLYYSLHAPAARGRNAGVHEALMGTGGMLLPLAGGWAARATGTFWMPFAVAAGAMLIAVAAQEILYRTRR